MLYEYVESKHQFQYCWCKHLNVTDNTGASKTIICFHCFRDWSWIDWYDSSRCTLVRVTSNTPMWNEEKPTTDRNEAKIFDTSKELL